MASFHHCLKSGKKGTAANHAAYITRQGKHSQREDLICSGHGNMPAWAKDNPSAFWKTGDKHERANGAVYREHEIALPAELTREQQKELVVEFIQVMVGSKPYEYAIHAPNSSIDGSTNTHVHLMFSDRMQDGIERSPEQTFSRYNAKQPERGGCKKDSGERTDWLCATSSSKRARCALICKTQRCRSMVMQSGSITVHCGSKASSAHQSVTSGQRAFRK